jgi:hypothetical protein
MHDADNNNASRTDEAIKTHAGPGPHTITNWRLIIGMNALQRWTIWAVCFYIKHNTHYPLLGPSKVKIEMIGPSTSLLGNI